MKKTIWKNNKKLNQDSLAFAISTIVILFLCKGIHYMNQLQLYLRNNHLRCLQLIRNKPAQ
jgi:hypothetical protein